MAGVGEGCREFDLGSLIARSTLMAWAFVIYLDHALGNIELVIRLILAAGDSGTRRTPQDKQRQRLAADKGGSTRIRKARDYQLAPKTNERGPGTLEMPEPLADARGSERSGARVGDDCRTFDIGFSCDFPNLVVDSCR